MKDLQVFKTRNGRTVYASGGITPDIEISHDSLTAYHDDLLKNGLLFDFATDFVSSHPVMDSSFTFHDSIMTLFEGYLVRKNYRYQSNLEKDLDKLKQTLAKEGYAGQTAKDVESLSQSVRQITKKQLSEKKTSISTALELELAGRYFGNRIRITRSFKSDRMIREALLILKNESAYHRLLGRK